MYGAVEAFKLMARFLYRATLNPYPDEAASRIEKTNRRIGVGLMGLQGWCIAQGRRLSDLSTDNELRQKLVHFRLACRQAADELADTLGLPRSVKVTAVAPTGSISALSGTQAGVHPVVAKYLIRRVRYAANSPALPELERSGYVIVDDPAAASTKVVEFPCIDPIVLKHPGREHLIEQADEFTFVQFMDLVLAVQETFCGGTDGQAVSATALLPEGMAGVDLFEAVFPFVGKLKGITAFPNKTRLLQPISPLSKTEYEIAKAQLDETAAFWAGMGEFEIESCVSGACPVK